MPWYTGVLLGTERFLASWHKSQEEASRLREVNRAAEALLANQKREKMQRRRGAGRERGNVEGALLVVIASGQPIVLCFCMVFLLFTFPHLFILLPWFTSTWGFFANERV